MRNGKLNLFFLFNFETGPILCCRAKQTPANQENSGREWWRRKKKDKKKNVDRDNENGNYSESIYFRWAYDDSIGLSTVLLNYCPFFLCDYIFII